jgi:hypothetical protein
LKKPKSKTREIQRAKKSIYLFDLFYLFLLFWGFKGADAKKSNKSK